MGLLYNNSWAVKNQELWAVKIKNRRKKVI